MITSTIGPLSRSLSLQRITTSTTAILSLGQPRLSLPCLPTSLWRHRQLSTRGGAEDHTPSLSSLPTPSATPLHMTVRELQEIMNNPALAAGQDYLVIDVRRDDMDAEPFNVVHPAAVNLPAQSFYQTLPMISLGQPRLSLPCLPTSLWRHRQLSTRGGAEDHTPSLSSLPTPSATPLHMTVRELQEIMNNPALAAGQDYLVIDVRRDDMDAEPFQCVHPAAVNLPAQSFYQTLPMIYCLLNRIPMVIFHCGGSKQRGPKCAGWYQDYLDQLGCKTSSAYVLVGGIKAWWGGGHCRVVID
ncbi:hypothetical protein A1Q2_00701 [Trichosporon asahii var. asahii CBS 8904]|uniref:Rhodanese domain-containing protein n=1 Tax=Trichosporon asahii var. asahii (strain CBS 8904) TaxID=1220162 RepID=K1VZK8_TRIAC|nr:hypothetical protein A1Q2_00701 [Trichosporon asahii var. asahii CBS 8904]